MPTTGVPATVTGGTTSSVCTKYCGQVTFLTARNTNTSPPSLFGDTRESSAGRLQAGLAVLFTSILMLASGLWLSGKGSRNAELAGIRQ